MDLGEARVDGNRGLGTDPQSAGEHERTQEGHGSERNHARTIIRDGMPQKGIKYQPLCNRPAAEGDCCDSEAQRY